MEDGRARKSKRAIKQAMLALLDKQQLVSITMSELAHQAGVSRSTLYAHFSNTQDVYEDLVRDFSTSLTPLGMHLRCQECDEQSAVRPFCLAVREAGEYLPVVRDGRFLTTLLGQLDTRHADDDLLGTYRSLGLDEDQARAVFRFQMSGCYSVARSELPSGEWARIQHTLDTFIRGGINALRAG